ncbi:hypothetical protein JY651_45010 [Pyxidicoccus parkwayensis]|uniref:Uncharacterized protein n=1 Tax=Pyxidicoccus parkwayensis TaxID=2813578 RepID=A0ABX7NTJ0_9BACT|nr:hypothetical protein [Pyxidicoccus parkwaysis]QSQ22214.1 hypothetical protein JY651_45010 [Pyxidicoccus parkwaysis]
MPFFIPFTMGGLVLTALGLGVKRVLGEAEPRTPEEARLRDARVRHREALASLKAARLRVRDGVIAWGELQSRAHAEGVVPFRALLERLERWELAKESDVLEPGAREALRAVPLEPPSRGTVRPWPLLGAGAESSPALVPVLIWLDRGWLEEDAPPVVVDGASLFEAAAPLAATMPGTEPDARVRALDEAAGTLAKATLFLGELHVKLEARTLRMAGVYGRASAQLAYLDPASFEDGSPEPRERLRRLAELMGEVAVLLRAPVLTLEGRLAPEPPGASGETPANQT